MNTQILSSSEKDIDIAANILKNGGLVAIPTETVYGLAADAKNVQAVKNIFIAKGRAQDNPLIVHISEISQLYPLVTEIPKKAEALAEKFWPGPLTMVFKKSDVIPSVVTCGGDTIAIRMPVHPIARKIIKKSGCPIAAPSANLSGSVSTVTAKHCIDDLDGKIDAILDGGKCDVGLESTVILMVGETPRLLRPGFVTVEQIEEVIGKINIDDAILHPLKEGVKPASPGMKYKHYSPNAQVIIIDADDKKYYDYVNQYNGENIYALCFDEDKDFLNKQSLSYGKSGDDISEAANLFDNLRKFDELGAKLIFARMPKLDGVGLAVVNRLLRSAGFEVIKL